MHRLCVASGASGLTLTFFLVLPLVEAITDEPREMLELTETGTVQIPPPPPPPEPERDQEEEPEPEEAPPELMEEIAPLDLAQLELALNQSIGDGLLGGDFAVKLDTVISKADQSSALSSLADLDQKPRVTYQPGPILNDKLRRKAPGSVFVKFIVDEEGRVVKPKVDKSSDRIFELAALAAIKKWRFEPGKRGGKAVAFPYRVEIQFQKGQ